jgi:hypothetical protein
MTDIDSRTKRYKERENSPTPDSPTTRPIEITNHLLWIKSQVENEALWDDDILHLNLIDSPSFDYYLENNLPVLCHEIIEHCKNYGYMCVNSDYRSYIRKI